MSSYAGILLLLSTILVVLPLRTQQQGLCSRQLDIALIIDQSGSILTDSGSARVWQDSILEFAAGLVHIFPIGPEMTRLGVVKFSTTARVVINLDEYMDRVSLELAIRDLEYGGGETNIAEGLNVARYLLNNTALGARNGVKKVAILVSDGRANLNKSRTQVEGNLTRAAGVEVFSVGVTNLTNEAEMKGIASAPTSTHYYFISDHDVLNKTLTAILAQLCTVLEPAPTSSVSTITPNQSPPTSTLSTITPNQSPPTSTLSTITPNQSPPTSSVSTVTPNQSPPTSTVPTVTPNQSPPTSTLSTITPNQSPPTSSVSTVTPNQSPPTSTVPTVTPNQSPPTSTLSTITPNQSPPTSTVSTITPNQSPPTSTLSTITPNQSPPTSTASTITPNQSPPTSTVSTITPMQSTTLFSFINSTSMSISPTSSIVTSTNISSPPISTVSTPQSTPSQLICLKRADIVLIIDESRNEIINGYSWYDFVRSFSIGIINALPIAPSLVRIGVVTYNTTAHIDIDLMQYVDAAALELAILNLQFQGGDRNTADGLNVARNLLFSSSRGARPWVEKVAFLVTNGQSSVNRDRTQWEADLTKSAGVEMYSIGVTNQVDEVELKSIASDPTATHFYSESNYNSVARAINSVLLEYCAPLQLTAPSSTALSTTRPSAFTNSTRVQDVVLNLTDTSAATTTRQNIITTTSVTTQSTWMSSPTQTTPTTNTTTTQSISSSNAPNVSTVSTSANQTTFTAIISTPTFSATATASRTSTAQHSPITATTSTTPTTNTSTVQTSTTTSSPTTSTTSTQAAPSTSTTTTTLTSNTQSASTSGASPVPTTSTPTSQTSPTPTTTLTTPSTGTSTTYTTSATTPTSTPSTSTTVTSTTQSTTTQSTTTESTSTTTSSTVTVSSSSTQSTTKAVTETTESTTPTTVIPCPKEIDIVLILDETTSIVAAPGGYENWYGYILGFAEGFVNGFQVDPEYVRIGVVKFSSSANIVITLNQYSDAASLAKAVKSLEILGGQTNIADGLRVGRSLLFNASQGARTGAKKMAFLVTDGRANVDHDLTPNEVNITKAAGVEIFCIGVTSMIFEQELISIASAPTSTHYYFVLSYNMLSQVLEQLRGTICFALQISSTTTIAHSGNT